MKTLRTTIAVCSLLIVATTSWAQSGRPDVLWARFTNGAPITLDGVLSEPEWALAESVVVQWATVTGIPGSGFRAEGGTLPSDPTYAVIKVLAKDNQIYMGATVFDKSIGGDPTFNRFDGFLMAIKDHLSGSHPAPPDEYFYSWWYPELTSPLPAGLGPSFRGKWGSGTTPRTPEQIDAWDAATVVTGTSNTDAVNDTKYVTEMRFNLTPEGYDITTADGDTVEWNVSVYDCDWFWPLIPQFSANRTWFQGPWGNNASYNEVRLMAKPSVTVTSGPVPASSLAPEFRIPSAGGAAAPVIDGNLNDPVWGLAPSIQMQYGNDVLRDSYPGLMRWRAGQYQPTVNASTAPVIDPNLCTVKYFFKGDSLYFGFDVQDLAVGNSPFFDRWDGMIVSIQERQAVNVDNVLLGRRLSFRVGTGGTFIPSDDLAIPTVGARVRGQLKPNTTVDTLGLDFDEGYTAEMVIDLTKLGYPSGRGDGIVFIGLNHLDGDSWTPFTDSYGTRTHWAREYETSCCSPWAYLDPSLQLVAGVGDEGPLSADFALLGSVPNPARTFANLRFSVPTPSRADLELFDVQGRLVATKALGVHSPGVRQALIPRQGLATGLYLARIRFSDPLSGQPKSSVSGKLMFVD